MKGIKFMAIGFELVGYILAAVFLGPLLDKYLNFSGSMIILIMVGFTAWVIRVLKMAQNYSE